MAKKKKKGFQSPDEFLADVLATISNYEGDKEALHSRTDDLMEELLIELGYGKAVKAIQKTTRYYA